MFATVETGESADRNRNLRRPGSSDAGLRDGLSGELGHNGEAIEVRGLALVGRHPEGGVALEMLDRAKALAHRHRDIAVGDVILQIDERLVACARDMPD